MSRESRIHALSEMVANLLSERDRQERRLLALTNLIADGNGEAYISRVAELEDMLFECLTYLEGDCCTNGCRVQEMKESIIRILSKVGNHPLLPQEAKNDAAGNL